MSDLNLDLPSLIDRSVKVLFRECPDVILKLAGMSDTPFSLTVEDPNLNLPELRADHVFIVQQNRKDSPKAIYLEYQLEPRESLLPSWSAKWAGLGRQLGIPVVLLVLYLEKKDRTTFPSQFTAEVGSLRTMLSFDTIRLWEHAHRIRSGELAELAPLLILCEESPSAETVREEVEIIHQSALSESTQSELMGLALMVASRSFGRDVLLSLFKEDLKMIQDTGLIGDWLKEWQEKGLEQGLEQGIEQGLAEGKQIAIREMTLRFLIRRFGELPETLILRIQSLNTEACQNLFDRAIAATSLDELTKDTME